ncbi:hypothetical protein HanIR_Chr05g0220391 [Helianthus annuus]|nr:hypothetical protein HanIR_Chr05g0220391 [Helianthus annuus]
MAAISEVAMRRALHPPLILPGQATDHLEILSQFEEVGSEYYLSSQPLKSCFRNTR